VGSEGFGTGKMAGAVVEGVVAAVGGGSGDNELGSDEEAVRCGSGCAEDLLMEFLERKFGALGIFAPWDKEAATAGVIGVGKKAKPVEVGHCEGFVRERAEDSVQVGGVVERVALDEDGDVGERVVPLGQVVKVGVGFAAGVGQRDGTGERGRAFVIDSDGKFAGDAFEPRENFVIPGDDKFKRRRHGERS
jgi:hypothetical protein